MVRNPDLTDDDRNEEPNAGISRRSTLKTVGAAGAALSGTALSVGTAAAESTWNYELVSEALDAKVTEVVVQGDWAYTATLDSITTVDLSDPTLPVVGGTAFAEGDDNRVRARRWCGGQSVGCTRRSERFESGSGCRTARVRLWTLRCLWTPEYRGDEHRRVLRLPEGQSIRRPAQKGEVY